MLFYELLKPDETITVDCHQQQFINLNNVSDEKGPFTGQGCRKVILPHDNARPHAAKATKQIPGDAASFDRCTL